MAGSDRDYGDEGKTSFSKKSKMAPKTSPKPVAKPSVATKSAPAKAGPMRPKTRPLAPAKSARPRTKNDWADDEVLNSKADKKLIGMANKKPAVKPAAAESMSRSELKKAGRPYSPAGKFIERISSGNPNPNRNKPMGKK